MWGQRNSVERPPHDFLKLLGYSFLVAVAGVAAVFGFDALSDHFHWHWASGPQTHTSKSGWFKWLFWGLVAIGYTYYVIVPAVLKRPAPGLSKFLVWILHVGPKKEQ